VIAVMMEAARIILHGSTFQKTNLNFINNLINMENVIKETGFCTVKWNGLTQDLVE
jgi:hypothetical protein